MTFIRNKYPALATILDLKAQTESLVNSLETKFPVELTLFYRKREGLPDSLQISGIVVPKNKRGLGIGTEVMQTLVDFADEHGLLVTLTPSRDFGASSIDRLRRFYGQFGFVRNLGRNKDYRFYEAMIRQPNS